MSRPSPAVPSVLFEKTFPVHEDLQLSLETPGVDLSLRPGAANEVTIEVHASNLDEESAQDLLQRLEVSIEEQRDHVSLKTAAPFQSTVSGWTPLESPVEVRISLPHHLRVAARCSGGMLQVVGVAGTFELDSFGGTLRVEDVEGSVEVRSCASAVRLRHLAGKRLAVETASGSLIAEDVRVESAHLALRACTTRLDRISGGLEISTAHGEMALTTNEGTLTLNGTCTPLTLSLEESIPARVSATAADVALLLDAHTAADLALASEETTIAESLPFTGEQENGTAKGQLGQGGPLITVETARGAVTCAAS